MVPTYVWWGVAGLMILHSAAGHPAESTGQPATAKAKKKIAAAEPKDGVCVLGSPRFGSRGSFLALALSLDDQQLITVAADSDEREIIIWDRRTEKSVHRLPHRWALRIALSADGARLASCGVEGEVRFWDVKAGKLLWRIPGNSRGTPFAVACSPDGKMVAVGKDKVEILDTATGKELRTIERSFNLVAAVAFSPDSNLLAAVDSAEFKIRLWNPHTGKVVRTLEGRCSPNALAFTPDGKELIGAGDLKAIPVWEVATGKLLQNLPGRSDHHSALALSKDGKLLAVGGGTRSASRRFNMQRSIDIWDLETGKLVHTLPAFSHDIYGLCFTSDGRTLISACASIRSWDVKTGRQIDPPAGHEDLVTALEFSADGKSLLSVGLDRTLRTWKLDTQEQVGVVPLPAQVNFETVLLSPRNKVACAALTEDAGVAVFDTSTGKELHRLADASVQPQAFPAFGKRITLKHAKGVMQWDFATGKVHKTWTIPASGFVFSSIDPTERFVVGMRSDFQARDLPSTRHMLLWDLTNNQSYHRFEANSPFAHPCTITPDGKTLLAWWADGLLWEIASAKPRGKLEHGSGEVGLPVVAPNGRWVAVISYHGLHLEIWDLLTQKRLYQSEVAPSYMSRPIWSEDSRTLAAPWGAQVAVWDVAKLVGAPAAPQPISRERFEKCWGDLASADAEVAYQAVRDLRLADSAFIPWMADQLKKIPAPDSTVVDRLLRELDHPQFAVRNKAMKELERMDPSIALSIADALKKPSELESKRRLETLYAKLTGPIVQPESLRVIRSLEVLENHPAPEARKALANLASAQPDRFWAQDIRRALERIEKTRMQP